MSLSLKVIPNIKGTITKLYALLFTTFESTILKFSILLPISTLSALLLIFFLTDASLQYKLTLSPNGESNAFDI